jgi:hypothetical protein
MPFKFIRTSRAQELINETKERVRDEISRMSDLELKDHLAQIRDEYESMKLIGDDGSKILYHELKIIRAENTKRINANNAKLARQFLKLQGNKKNKCPHCGKRIHLDML